MHLMGPQAQSHALAALRRILNFTQVGDLCRTTPETEDTPLYYMPSGLSRGFFGIFQPAKGVPTMTCDPAPNAVPTPSPLGDDLD